MSTISPQVEAQTEYGELVSRLNAELSKPGMTIRNVAAFTGLDKSTILRAKQQKPVEALAYIAIRQWLTALEPQQEEAVVEYGKALNAIRRKAIALSQRATDGYAEIQSIAVDALNCEFTHPTPVQKAGATNGQ